MGALLQSLIELLLTIETQRRDKASSAPVEASAVMDCNTLPYLCMRKSPLTPERVQGGSCVEIESPMDSTSGKMTAQFVIQDETRNGQTIEASSLTFHAPDIHVKSTIRDNHDTVARLRYFEVTPSSLASENESLRIGFSNAMFDINSSEALGDVAGTFALDLTSGALHAKNCTVIKWEWETTEPPVSVDDTFGAGLRLDTSEIFFTRNGVLLGTAFSSIRDVSNLVPTLSTTSSCVVHINAGEYENVPNPHFFDFALHFGSVDWSDLLRGMEWIRPISEMYGIMEALTCPEKLKYPENRRLPDEFMLSADNFLSAISQEECITIESEHPYDVNQPQQGFINIPLAMSMRITLDPSCETLNSHCLQIIQGGPESSSSDAEGDVRCFTGSCGGQEITIRGGTFKWKFPLASNFQCRLDRHRKGTFIRLEARDTRIALTRDKGWQCALGLAKLDAGTHVWEVKIVSVTSSSNIFLGVAKRDVRLDSYLGKDNRGWGWIGNRALWHNGGKQQGTYGEKFVSGDVVRMTLDLKKGTLSYALNGKDLGVAFGPGGVGPKLIGPLYPGFSVYNQRDCVELIGGHRMEEGKETTSDVYYDSGDDLSEDEMRDEIPTNRITIACELSALGFPIDWCVYALKHCMDDTAEAADFILNNLGNLEALVKDEAEIISRRMHAREERERLAENVDTAAGAKVGDEEESKVMAPPAMDKWGIKFTAIPEFTLAGRRLLASKHVEKLEALHTVHAQFHLQHDEAVTSLADEQCSNMPSGSSGSDPLRLQPDELEVSSTLSSKYGLSSFTQDEIRSRFLVIRNFNLRLQTVFPFIDFTASSEASVLARGLKTLRGCMFRSVKLAWWVNILRDTQTPNNARPEIEVDRHIAGEIMQKNTASASALTGTVFGQVFTQLQSTSPSVLRGSDRAFKCQFVGEFGDDFGGLYRECLAQMSAELQSKVLPLLEPCSNALKAVGGNRDLFVPNVHIRQDPKLIQMLEFVGKLMGMSIRSATPLDLNLPSMVWKCLVNDEIVRSDVESIHESAFQIVDTIDSLHDHHMTAELFEELIDTPFIVTSHDGQEIELVPGGKAVQVTWEDKDDYARAVETYRLIEFNAVCEDISRGLATIIPRATLSMFTWKEFELLVCGKPTVDVELLKRRTIYGDGCSATDVHIAYFWEAMHRFTEEQRSLFLRFVWGRSRLPPHASDFTQDFKISGMAKSSGNPNGYLPLAHTCFFSIDIPAYTSADMMHDRLVYAITHCQAIDADNTNVAHRAASMGSAIGSTMGSI